jgi:hypothetical protein
VNPHIPQKLPLDDLDWVRLIPLMSEANRQLARYAGVLNAIPNPDVFLAPLTLQEAVLSSRIEGAQETLEDVLRYEASAPTPPAKLPGIQALDAIFKQPIFSTASFVEALGIPRRTAIDLLAKMKESGIVETREAGAGSRPDVLAYAELLDIIG